MVAQTTPPGKQSGLAKKTTPKSKSSNIRIYIGIGVGILALVLYIGLKPLQGTIKFGICRVFVERTVAYPPTLRILAVQERPQDVRIDYTSLNEFGESVVKQATCTFRPDPANPNLLSGVVIAGRKAPARDVAIFNTTIPFIMANPPSLILPLPMPVDLSDLWSPS